MKTIVTMICNRPKFLSFPETPVLTLEGWIAEQNDMQSI